MHEIMRCERHQRHVQQAPEIMYGKSPEKHANLLFF